MPFTQDPYDGTDWITHRLVTVWDHVQTGETIKAAYAQWNGVAPAPCGDSTYVQPLSDCMYPYVRQMRTNDPSPNIDDSYWDQPSQMYCDLGPEIPSRFYDWNNYSSFEAGIEGWYSMGGNCLLTWGPNHLREYLQSWQSVILAKPVPAQLTSRTNYYPPVGDPIYFGPGPDTRPPCRQVAYAAWEDDLPSRVEGFRVKFDLTMHSHSPENGNCGFGDYCDYFALPFTAQVRVLPLDQLSWYQDPTYGPQLRWPIKDPAGLAALELLYESPMLTSDLGQDYTFYGDWIDLSDRVDPDGALAGQMAFIFCTSLQVSDTTPPLWQSPRGSTSYGFAPYYTRFDCSFSLEYDLRPSRYRWVYYSPPRDVCSTALGGPSREDPEDTLANRDVEPDPVREPALGSVGTASPALHSTSTLDGNGQEWNGAWPSTMQALCYDVFDGDTGLASWIDTEVITPPQPDPAGPMAIHTGTFSSPGGPVTIPVTVGNTDSTIGDVDSLYVLAVHSSVTPTTFSAAFDYSTWIPLNLTGSAWDLAGSQGTLRATVCYHELTAADKAAGQVTFPAPAGVQVDALYVQSEYGSLAYWDSTANANTTTTCSTPTSFVVVGGKRVDFFVIEHGSTSGVTISGGAVPPTVVTQARAQGADLLITEEDPVVSSYQAGPTATAVSGLFSPAVAVSFGYRQTVLSASVYEDDPARFVAAIGRSGAELTWDPDSRVRLPGYEWGSYSKSQAVDLCCLGDGYAAIGHGVIADIGNGDGDVLEPCLSLVRLADGVIEVRDSGVLLDPDTNRGMYDMGNWYQGGTGHVSLIRLSGTRFLAAWCKSGHHYDTADVWKDQRPTVRVCDVVDGHLVLGPVQVMPNPVPLPGYTYAPDYPDGNYYYSGGLVKGAALAEDLAVLIYTDVQFPEALPGSSVRALRVVGDAVEWGEPRQTGNYAWNNETCHDAIRLTDTRAAVSYVDYSAGRVWGVTTTGTDGCQYEGGGPGVPVIDVVEADPATLAVTFPHPSFVLDAGWHLGNPTGLPYPYQTAFGQAFDVHIEGMGNGQVFCLWATYDYVRNYYASRELYNDKDGLFVGLSLKYDPSTACGWVVCGGTGYDDLWVGSYENSNGHEEYMVPRWWPGTPYVLLGFSHTGNGGCNWVDSDPCAYPAAGGCQPSYYYYYAITYFSVPDGADPLVLNTGRLQSLDWWSDVFPNPQPYPGGVTYNNNEWVKLFNVAPVSCGGTGWAIGAVRMA